MPPKLSAVQLQSAAPSALQSRRVPTALPASLASMTPQKYWNLPGQEGDAGNAVNYGGLWDPQLDSSESLLRARAQSRQDMENRAEDQSIDALPIDQRAQATFMAGFNRRQQNTMPEWDAYIEALNETGAGGKQVKIAGGDGLPADTTHGTLPLSLQNIPGAAYGYDSFGAPTSITQGGKPESPDDQAALRKRAQPTPWGVGGNGPASAPGRANLYKDPWSIG